MDLAADPTWIKLLHYEADAASESGLRSAVKSPEFFNAAEGRVSPRMELSATLEAFGRSVPDDPNAHPQCLFRARFFWLQKRLGFTERDFPIVACPLYDRWTLGGTVESISVVFATGYLGNPASYYGHTLLKFNDGGANRHSDLLDVSVNYGAIVPDGANPVSYILNGVLGGYDAGFSHIQFYYHNHNYSELELRDVWEYELDLTPAQVAMITAHSWELLGKRYAYFFFRRNCAYRMGEILELIDGVKVIPGRRPWTIPQTLVHSLATTKVDGKPLLKDIRYYPSRQSRLYQRFVALNDPERRVSRAAVDNDAVLDSDEFQQLPRESQVRILDTLIDYYQYLRDPRWPADHPVSQAYNRALARRFTAHVDGTPALFAAPPAPHVGRDPSVVRIGPSHSPAFGNGLALQVRPAYYDALDSGAAHVANSTLIMFEVDARIFDDTIFLRRLDIFNVESVNGNVTGYPSDDGAAWNLRLGFQQQNLSCRGCLVGRLTGAYGRATRLGDHLLVGALAGGAVQDNDSRSGIAFGSITGFANLEITPRLRVRASYEFRDHFAGDLGIENVINAGLRYAVGDNWELRLEYSRNVSEELDLLVGYHW